jgi:hypothetical protein
VADLVLRVESNSELDGINHLKQLAVQGVGSPHSRRAYETAIEEFISWSLHVAARSASTPPSSVPTRIPGSSRITRNFYL